MAAGGMAVVGIPFYKNMSVHWTLTILGAISLLLVPVPYLFYKYGPWIRSKSMLLVGSRGRKPNDNRWSNEYFES